MLIASPRQQWLRERASALRYTHIASLVGTYFVCEPQFYLFIYLFIYLFKPSF
jgi:hypothetical protein